MSLPSRERVLKLCRLAHIPASKASLPSRERVLKLNEDIVMSQTKKSLPSRERVLKHATPENHTLLEQVAPFAGACVETTVYHEYQQHHLGSLPSRERVLKHGKVLALKNWG